MDVHTIPPYFLRLSVVPTGELYKTDYFLPVTQPLEPVREKTKSVLLYFT